MIGSCIVRGRRATNRSPNSRVKRREAFHNQHRNQEFLLLGERVGIRGNIEYSYVGLMQSSNVDALEVLDKF